jgi:hypothetical protein
MLSGRTGSWPCSAPKPVARVAQLCELTATEVRSLSRRAGSAAEDRSPTRAAVAELPHRPAAADDEDRPGRSDDDEMAADAVS